PWVLNCAAIVMTMLTASQNVALLWVIPLVLAGGFVIGLVNGVGVALFGVPPIIMTLAANVILQGLILVFTGGSPTPPAPSFIQLLAVGRLGGIPIIGFIWVALAIIAWVLLSKAAFGRHLYALGTSAEVAEFSGVPTARTTIVTYVISGLTAALTGILLTGYSGQAYLGMGDSYLFTSIAAVAIGGASMLGGGGHYIGTIAGALILTILSGLLPALNLSSGALLVVYGMVILLTVALGSEQFAVIGGLLFARRGNK
ncbi:MAG: ABC transporter permease, partial [Rhizobiaceae bacterium]|nr:ABC transporter permease [Rhizobiaceae bacterium]